MSGARDLAGARVAIDARPSAAFIAAMLGTWKAGGVVVPLATSHPPAERDYVMSDSGASLVVSPQELLLHGDRSALPDIDPARPALILYTSGTTARSKGVVTTHANIAAQVTSLITAWEWTAADRTLLVLPLHHVHGLINVVASALWSGAACEILPRFDAAATWSRLASGEVSVFTAVPTIYHRLIAAWDAAPAAVQHAWSAGARGARLLMCGSAALPVTILERWRDITGHTLLERYGMTEIGMALSNPLHGARRPGHVGSPLPGVQVRVVDDSGDVVQEGTPGEIEVRGPGVFAEYWQRPDETRAAFRDGWFRTGDVAVVSAAACRILGRRSVDIIKSGGHKISALEIEEVMRAHPAVSECAVVAVPDPEWGERICAAVELGQGQSLSLDDLRAWLSPRLAPYKIPRALECSRPLPRNAMGKVIKPEVARWFTGDAG